MTNQTTTKYRIRNWAEYNRALVQRGSLTIWFSPEAVEGWLCVKEGKKGRPTLYSHEAILCALMLKAVYHLPFRALRGLLLSLVMLLGVGLPIPCYTRICRRAKILGQQIKNLSSRRPTDLVFDSTGLKVYGEGEWKVRQHGKSKRRIWKKIHLAICPDSHDIILECLTGNEIADCEVAVALQHQIPKSVKRSYGDGAYDKDGCYRMFHSLGIEPIIPPQKNGVVHNSQTKPWLQARNDSIRELAGWQSLEEQEGDGRRLWKKLRGYHRRSIGETAMYRLKALFGSSLKCKHMCYQKAEIFSKCLTINRMNALGMPKGEWITA